MVTVPTDLNDWTLDTIAALIANSVYEDDRFDFKGALSDRNDKGLARTIARCACSMANADGGFIIFGVKDRGSVASKAAADPAARLVGISAGNDHAKQFGDKVAHIQPSIDFRPANPIPLVSTGSVVFVVEIAASTRGPHMFEGTFYTRGNGGSARAMTPYEVRDQMLRTESLLQQVRMVRFKLHQWEAKSSTATSASASELRSFYAHFDTEPFEVLLASVCMVLPATSGLLKELLLISSNAQEFNVLISRWKFNDFDGHRLQSDTPEAAEWVSKVSEHARRLQRQCQQAQSELGELFGPLVPED